MSETMKCYEAYLKLLIAKGKNAKRDLLYDIPDTLKNLMELALHPYHHFGVTSLDERELYISDENDDWTLILNLLRSGDGKALNDVAMSQEAERLVNLTLAKHFNIGIARTSFLQVYPNAFPEFDCMLASAADDKAWEHIEESFKNDNILYVQPKIDGVRCLVFIEEGKDTICLSRAGKPILNIREDVLEELQHGPDGVYDGEVLFENNFPLTSGLTRKKDTDKRLDYYIYDRVPLDSFKSGKFDLPYASRLFMIRTQEFKCAKVVPNTLISDQNFNKEVLYDIAKQHIRDGWEGAVVKTMSHNYQKKRSRDWVKIKPEETGDFEIVGIEEGKGRNKGRLGAIIVQHDNTTTNVGSGFSDEERDDLWANSPVGVVAEVKYHMWTENGRLREPRFVRLRHDKTEAGI